MISRLEIQGFKSLVDTKVDLGAVNVFIGANGSGKSNLLEAMGVLSAIVSGSLEAESIRYRGVREGSPRSFQSSLSSFPRRQISIMACDAQTSYHVRFGPDDEHPSRWAIEDESINFEGSEILSRTGTSGSILIGEQLVKMPVKIGPRSTSLAKAWMPMFMINGGFSDSNSRHVNKIDSRFNFSLQSALETYAIYSPSTPQLRGFLDDIRREPLGLGGSGLGRAVDEMMEADPERIGPFDLEDVFELIDWADSLHTESDPNSGQSSSRMDGPIRLRIGDRYTGGALKTVSLLEASEGALYVLFLLALVAHEQSPKLFAVDNFDQALHPRLACALTRMVSEQLLRDGSRQMLATTHNPLVLDGLDLLDDRIRLFAVDRDSDGASQVHRVVVTDELMAQSEHGLSLSRLWLMGRLGGVPKNL